MLLARSHVEAATSKIATWLVKLIGILGMALVFVNVLQISLRATVRYSFPWVGEASTFMGVWIVLLGASVIFLRGEEVQVTALVSMLPRVVQRAVDVLIGLVAAAFGIALFVANLKYSDLVNMTKPFFLPVEHSILIYPVYVLAISIVIWSILSIWAVLERRPSCGIISSDGLANPSALF